MSYSRYATIVNVQAALQSEVELADEVQRLLSLSRPQALSIIGRTTITAYRRVHEVLASAIDYAIEACRHVEQQVSEQRAQEYKARVITALTRGLIMVKYQAARGQLSQALASTLDTLLRELVDRVKRESLAELRGAFEHARILLDALAVLAYQYGRKSGR